MWGRGVALDGAVGGGKGVAFWIVGVALWIHGHYLWQNTVGGVWHSGRGEGHGTHQREGRESLSIQSHAFGIQRALSIDEGVHQLGL